MRNFNDMLAEYLELYGRMVRVNGQEIEFRGIQYNLNQLASIVRAEDIASLSLELEDLKNWYDEVE